MNAHSAAVRLAIISMLFLPCLGQSRIPADAAGSDKKPETISVFLTVEDSHGSLIPNLGKDSFQLRVDGQAQTIQSVASSSDLPLNVGVLLDAGGLMQGALPAAKAAASDFLGEVITRNDLAFVISFGASVDLLQDLTNDVRLLHSGLESAKVNVGLHSARSAGMLNDAVYLAADEILGKQVGRKAMILFTAGADHGSKVKLKEAIQAAQKADAVCYLVVFARSIFGMQISDLADQTGGRMITVHNSDKLTDAIKQIKDELRNQYVLTYAPESSGHFSGFHTIEITAKEGYKIRARKGYYTAGGN
jgi:VWFA-related protein